jgi:hypothetical protein
VRYPQGLIHHFPKNRFVRIGEWLDHVIHNCFGAIAPIMPDGSRNNKPRSAVSLALASPFRISPRR